MIPTENRLMEVAKKALPKELRSKDVVAMVEVDTFGNSDRDDGISYWVFLKTHYRSENGLGCHTVHEDTLAEVKRMMASIVYIEDDYDGYNG